MEQADIRYMFRKTSKIVCTLTVVVYPAALSPPPSHASTMKTQWNTEDDPDDLAPAVGDTQMEYSCN